MYGFLMAFTHGTTPCYSHLYHKYGEELINEALKNGYITPIGETPDGETKEHKETVPLCSIIKAIFFLKVAFCINM